jgi:para-nitrobenzyl esterase
VAQAAGLGVFHGSEIPYVFGTLSPQLGFTAADSRLSDEMMGYWTRFARTGDPNGDGAPAWPAYEPGRDTVMSLDVTPRVMEGFRKDKLDLLAQTLDQGLLGVDQPSQ